MSHDRRTVGLATLVVLLTSAGPQLAEAQPQKINPAPTDYGDRVRIPAGVFTMGYPNTVANFTGERLSNEGPVHEVRMSAFEIHRTEVTVGMWVDFLNKAGGLAAWHPLQPVDRHGSRFAAAVEPTEPARGVSWAQARAHCRWLGMDLPTEAQWERAAHGPGVGPKRYPWGDEDADCRRANLSHVHAQCHDGPRPVGAHSPDGDSAEGVVDLAGNVSEWVRDVYAYAYSPNESDPAVDPTGPGHGTYRVVRGGSYLEHPPRGRVSARLGAPPHRRSVALGFRCARPAQDDPVDEPHAAPLTTDGEGPAYARPSPRADPPEILATGLHGAQQLILHGEQWLIPTVAGELWSVQQGQPPELIASDLPEGLRLVPVGETLMGWTREAIYHVASEESPAVIEIRVEALEQIVAVESAEQALWWIDTTANGLLRRMSLADAEPGSVDNVADRLGTVTALLVRPDEILLGVNQDADRGLARVDRTTGEVQSIADSMFIPRQIIEHDGQIYGLLRGGNRLTAAGYIERLDRASAPALAPLILARHGSGDLQAVDDTLYWFGPWAVFQVGLDGDTPQALALDTAPAGLWVDDAHVTWVDGWRGELRRYRR